MTYIPLGPKQPVQMALSQDLIKEARALNPNLSETVETLLAAHVRAEKRRVAQDPSLIPPLQATHDV
jgi:post-segregation antitoxin (ccd killing protein)